MCTDYIQSYWSLREDLKMTYEKPELELIELEANDIVTSSTSCVSDSGSFDGFPPVVC